MISLRKARCSWVRKGLSARILAVAAVALPLGVVFADSEQIAKGRKAPPPRRAIPGGKTQPTVAVPLVQPIVPPEFADAFPSEIRKPAPDLLLSKDEERKADALSAFAQGLVAEDNAESDKALAGYRRALELDPGYAELAIKVAYELARRNDVAGGIQVLKDTIKAAPKEPMPLIYLSQLYSKHLKKPDLALKYAEQAFALAPDNFAAHLALYELHLSAGQTKKAEQVLERAAKSPTDDAKYWVQLGDLYTRLYLKEDGTGEPQAIEKMNGVYRKAAELGKTDVGVLSKVGDYFVLSRQVKEAMPFYRAALEHTPKQDDPPLNNIREKLARACLVNGQRDEAIGLLEQVTKESPVRFETFELLGELYEQKGDLDKALANYEHSLLLDASEPQNYLRLAETLLRLKRFDKAVDTMRAARAQFPDRPEITLNLALTLSQAKRHTDAMTVFAEAQAEAEQSHEEMLTAQFYFQYGAVAEQAGLHEKAAELLKRSIELDPANAAQAYNYLGYMWVDRGERLDEAGEMIKKAVAMDSDNGAFIDSLGWFYFKKGDYERAVKELLRAAEIIKPEDAVVFDHVGDAYQALGRTGDALTYWQKALVLEQDNKKIADKIDAAKQKLTQGKAAEGVP